VIGHEVARREQDRRWRTDEMTGKVAGLLFLGICAVLAALLLTSAITRLIGGCIFAISLIVLGGLSHGFRKS
jgi:hypothetical protein